MMKHYIILGLLFGILGLNQAVLANETALLNQFLDQLNTLQAQFQQKLYNEQGELLETSAGQLSLKRPNRFRWHYQNPYEQLIVADGEYVWIYDTDLEQVTQRELAQALGNTPAFLISPVHQVDQDFTVALLENSEVVTRFLLKPKNSEAQFSSIEIWLKDMQLQGLRLQDNLGQFTAIDFSNQVLNQALDEKLFIFTPPPHVDVIQDM
ncbi:outer membrane lipoprotein chaperone LolA [Thioflexithrix psekupsensis]|uniref:Outer-membrane lipoprotein carrier protein n=1 Tax=Thioflexithrix psekupsensis TaxID=1570016 RepID=A0A251XAS2_9GAMM|nr:outer membrane lipoprotein chaperone LolA [Thioflexithrix psekupsensis]OUD15071.1 outer membrane lipoprotein carrier protein LolA [Thioflexithrix psekupsensis]